MNPIYRKAHYLTSATTLSQLPEDTGIEVAFAGRSNAGKSSAINVITDNRGLARVSRTPGRTQMINFFNIVNDKHLVDLPGYGYAKVPEKLRRSWQRTMQGYFETRKSLCGLIIVMDIRRPLEALDWQMIEWCLDAKLKLHILLTKADKLTKNTASKALHKVIAQLEEANVEASLQLFSSHTKQGLDDIHELLNSWYGDF